MPPVTQFLVIANVAMFLLTQMAGPAIIQWFALWPLGSGLFMPWQLASYGFLHAGLTHLMFNMFGIWMFGSELERVWGSRRMAVFFGVSVLAAAVAQLVVGMFSHSMAPTTRLKSPMRLPQANRCQVRPRASIST